MGPNLKRVAPFLVSGIMTRTCNKTEADPSTGKIAFLWSRFFGEDIARKIPHTTHEGTVYGVYSEYESDVYGQFNLTAGKAVTVPSDEIGFNTVEIHEGDYLVFERNGEMPKAVIDTWTEIWRFFADNPQWHRKYDTDFEAYGGPADIAIYIGVVGQKKGAGE